MSMGYGGVFGKPKPFGLFGGFGFPKRDKYDLEQPMPQAAPQTAPQEGPGRWIDGGKFGLKDGLAVALGAIGSGFAGNNQFSGFLAQNMLQNRALKQRQRELEQQRQYGLQDYEAKKQIDQRYAAPPAPDAFERALTGAGINPSSPEGIQLYQRRAEAMARDPNDEFVVVPLPDGRTYAGPKSGMAAAFGQERPSKDDVAAEMRRRGLM